MASAKSKDPKAAATGAKAKASTTKASDEGGVSPFLVFLVFGVWGSFVVFGYYTELLTRAKYTTKDGVVEKWTFSTMMTLAQSVGNVAVSGAVLALAGAGQGGMTGGVPAREYLVVALGYMGAHKLGYASLLYIPFPLQVLLKSSKTIPVMFGEYAVANNKPSAQKLWGVLVLTCGIVVFMFFKPSAKKGSASAFDLSDPSSQWGMLLVAGALVCDGVYGPYQSKIKGQYDPTKTLLRPWHLMFNVNLWQGILTLPFAVYAAEGQPSELSQFIAFAARHQATYVNLAYFAAAMAMGNCFIYSLQNESGALTVTIATTVRKFLSVLVSAIYMGNPIANPQWIGIALVFLSSQIGKQLAAVGKAKED